MLKIDMLKMAFAIATVGTCAFAGEDLAQEWVEAMNACEALVSDQSLDGFQDYSDAPSKFNVEPQLERGFQHPDLKLKASAMSDGSEWFLCEVNGDTGTEFGTIVGALTGELYTQIRDHGDHSMIFEDGKTFAPIRVICRGDGQLTTVAAYVQGEENTLAVAAVSMLPNGATSPCVPQEKTSSNN